MRIIPRRIEIEKVERAGPWKLLYGRRKTGKSFLVENFLKYDRFFFVNRDGTVIDKQSLEKYTPSEFLRIYREVREGRSLVIDEFHRLPEEFLDFLHSGGVVGNLILITSTLWLAKKLMGTGSPLFGLVHPVRIGLVDERDILLALSREVKEKELLESAVYLREPFLIQAYRPPLREFLPNFLYEYRFFLRELLGEIFTEEERELTNLYDGVLRAVADGKSVSTEISSLLFSRGLLSKDNPGILQKYLDILTEIGLIQRHEVWGRKKFRYFHASPVLDLHFYLEEKYAYSELEVPVEYIKKVVVQKLPFHIQWFVRDLLSKCLGLLPRIIEEKGVEVDVALFEFKNLRAVAEVKWKEFLDAGEIRSIEEKLSKFSARKILVVPDKRNLEKEPRGVEVLDVADILDLVKGRP